MTWTVATAAAQATATMAAVAHRTAARSRHLRKALRRRVAAVHGAAALATALRLVQQARLHVAVGTRGTLESACARAGATAEPATMTTKKKTALMTPAALRQGQPGALTTMTMMVTVLAAGVPAAPMLMLRILAGTATQCRPMSRTRTAAQAQCLLQLPPGPPRRQAQQRASAGKRPAGA